MFNAKKSERTGGFVNLMSHGYQGRLISLEGIDGSGKSTLARGIAQRLNAMQITTMLTKEPGGTELGVSLRQILQTQSSPVCDKAEYLLFAADRAQHFNQMIIPALQAGTVAIADRLADSSLAYQGYGRGLDKRMIQEINTWVMQNITPDITIYLKLDPESALDRVQKRNEIITAFEQEKAEFWHRVAQGYQEIFASRTNVITLDASMSPQALCDAAMAAIIPRIM